MKTQQVQERSDPGHQHVGTLAHSLSAAALATAWSRQLRCGKGLWAPPTGSKAGLWAPVEGSWAAGFLPGSLSQLAVRKVVDPTPQTRLAIEQLLSAICRSIWNFQ